MDSATKRALRLFYQGAKADLEAAERSTETDRDAVSFARGYWAAVAQILPRIAKAGKEAAAAAAAKEAAAAKAKAAAKKAAASKAKAKAKARR